MIDTIQTASPQADDDFLLDDGLPCLRRDGKLYYLNDVQPRVLEACRHFEISFDQLSEKLGMNRPALLLILKGYDAVPLPLKSMIDRLLGQVGLLPPLAADLSAAANDAAPASASGPVVTTIHSVPVPEPVATEEPVITVTAEEVGEAMIPQPLTPGRPAASVPPMSVPPMSVPMVFAAGLPEFTPGLRRAPRRRRQQLGA